jgi:hypothetical protein
MLLLLLLYFSKETHFFPLEATTLFGLLLFKDCPYIIAIVSCSPHSKETNDALYQTNIVTSPSTFHLLLFHSTSIGNKLCGVIDRRSQTFHCRRNVRYGMKDLPPRCQHIGKLFHLAGRFRWLITSGSSWHWLILKGTVHFRIQRTTRATGAGD